jgi:hypothetical protein
MSERLLSTNGRVVIIRFVSATLAQLAEHSLRKREVKGSSPLGGLAIMRMPWRKPGRFFMERNGREP